MPPRPTTWPGPALPPASPGAGRHLHDVRGAPGRLACARSTGRLPHGPARDAAREQRTILRQQAFAGVSRSLGSVGLTVDPVDLVAATGVWEHMVSVLMLFWRNHPEESAAAMVVRAHPPSWRPWPGTHYWVRG